MQAKFQSERFGFKKPESLLTTLKLWENSSSEVAKVGAISLGQNIQSFQNNLAGPRRVYPLGIVCFFIQSLQILFTFSCFLILGVFKWMKWSFRSNEIYFQNIGAFTRIQLLFQRNCRNINFEIFAKSLFIILGDCFKFLILSTNFCFLW